MNVQNLDIAFIMANQNAKLAIKTQYDLFKSLQVLLDTLKQADQNQKTTEDNKNQELADI